ncbi:hypothetical protein DDE18_12755 [Nocardioides gansuensis]|uniref:FAD dependent oxidoreductase domain-containing protein n=1 Tax=Nocardioides gansuensis TaxID=2138300 RepID=A0A2T8F9I7_9ACTN|nr:FAD-binding oxidoreductase [Nocardioides gansuensis]PVG82349.1 hypothetical protein DDE18_12755 [Nocardioides gansuensis]
MIRPGRSLWLDRPSTAGFPRLASDLDCEVLVIGGGMTGTCTAWELATSGVDVVLLEATRIAGGTTGASTAKVTALQATAYSQLVRLVGIERARAYAEVQMLAVEHLATVGERLGAEAWMERCPSWLFAETEEGAEALAAEREAAQKCGLRIDGDQDPALPFPGHGCPVRRRPAADRPRRPVRSARRGRPAARRPRRRGHPGGRAGHR